MELNYSIGLQDHNFSEVLKLYESLNWTNYTKNPERLKLALNNSSFIATVSVNGQLTGLVRSVSDGVSIHYLQDILVHNDFQRMGLGSKLVKMALKHFKDVRTHILLTDDEEKQKQFYESLDFKNTKELELTKLNTFIQIKDTVLS